MVKDQTVVSLAEAALLTLGSVMIGAFSLFVGYHKTFSPLAVLAENTAWTVHLPEWLGRMVGVAELAAASALLLALVFRNLARPGWLAALWITLNHGVAAVVHVLHDELPALPANAFWIALCMLVTWLAWRRANRRLSVTAV
jgi:DoxX-like family